MLSCSQFNFTAEALRHGEFLLFTFGDLWQFWHFWQSPTPRVHPGFKRLTLRHPGVGPGVIRALSR